MLYLVTYISVRPSYTAQIAESHYRTFPEVEVENTFIFEPRLSHMPLGAR